MRKLIFRLACLCIAVISCNQQQDRSSTNNNIVPVNTPANPMLALNSDIANLLQDAPQLFNVAADAIHQVTAKNGLKVTVDPAQLEALDGSGVTGNIELSIREMQTAKEMLRNNCPTVADGRMLVSGGSYFVGMNNNGRELRIKSGGALKMEFPKIAAEGMELFSGKRDENGMMNWTPTNAKLTSPAAAAPVSAENDNSSTLQTSWFNRNSYSGGYDPNSMLRSQLTASKFRALKFKLFDDSVFAARRKYLGDNSCHMTAKQVAAVMEAPVAIPAEYYRRYSFDKVLMPLKFNEHVYWSTFGNHSYTFLPAPRNAVILQYHKDSIFGLQPLKETPDDIALAKLVSDMASVPVKDDLETLTTVDTVGPVRDGIKITMPAKTKISVQYYEPVEIESLGWINCDRFYDSPNEIVPEFTLDIKGQVPEQVGVFAIFKNLNSMIFVKGATNGKALCKLRQNIPMNTELELIVYSKIDNKFVQCKTKVKMGKDLVVPVELVPVPAGELKKVMVQS